MSLHHCLEALKAFVTPFLMLATVLAKQLWRWHLFGH